MEAAMGLMRRIPPKHTETALSALLSLLPDHSFHLISQVDQPLQVLCDVDYGKEFILCEYNRDADSYRDADGGPDEEVADEYWANHIARNDSIIVDVCQVTGLLNKMQLHAKKSDSVDKWSTFIVSVPPTRSDILHPCDVAEDVCYCF